MSTDNASTLGQHSVEKIGGTSMTNYSAVRDNIFLNPSLAENYYNRIFVVSAYGGITDLLLEHKKTGTAGIYGLFADSEISDAWQEAFDQTRRKMLSLNAELFSNDQDRKDADSFILDRLSNAECVLNDLQNLCKHGHFSLSDHLQTVREMLASLGEIHSASNLARLLQQEGVNAKFIDLSGWNNDKHLSLDEQISTAFAGIEFDKELPIVTGYCHCEGGLMANFDRGYSEMTFSRVAVLTNAKEAIIHKEFHLSSADPRLVGEQNAVPIGRTNYNVADQLANLGMEAIHPKAAKGLRQKNILLRVKNTFEPDHEGTLISREYVSKVPRVEIIAGRKNIFALEVFDQDMVGDSTVYEAKIVEQLQRFKAQVVTMDVNANTITYYLATNLKTVKRLQEVLNNTFEEAAVKFKSVCIVSAIGSHMKIPGMLAKTTSALAGAGVSILAMHQSMRQVDMQFVLEEDDYDTAVKSLHQHLIEAS